MLHEKMAYRTFDLLERYTVLYEDAGGGIYVTYGTKQQLLMLPLNKNTHSLSVQFEIQIELAVLRTPTELSCI